MTDQTKHPANVGYAFALGAQFGDGMQLSVSFTLATSATQTDFDAEMDKFRLAVERQRLISSIPELETTIKKAETDLIVIDSHVASFDRQFPGGKRKDGRNDPPSNDTAAYNNNLGQKQRTLVTIEAARQALTKAQKAAGAVNGA